MLKECDNMGATWTPVVNGGTSPILPCVALLSDVPAVTPRCVYQFV